MAKQSARSLFFALAEIKWKCIHLVEVNCKKVRVAGSGTDCERCGDFGDLVGNLVFLARDPVKIDAAEVRCS